MKPPNLKDFHPLFIADGPYSLSSVDVDFDLLYLFLYFLVRLSGPMGASVRPYGKAIDRCTHSPARMCRASR